MRTTSHRDPYRRLDGVLDLRLQDIATSLDTQTNVPSERHSTAKQDNLSIKHDSIWLTTFRPPSLYGTEACSSFWTVTGNLGYALQNFIVGQHRSALIKPILEIVNSTYIHTNWRQI